MGTKLQEKTFANFALLRFENSHFISHEGKPLTQPLLKFSLPLDLEAARAVSLAILRYTEDDLDPPGPYSNKSLYRELISGLKQGSKDGTFSPCSLIKARKITDLDKVHLICGLGILGPQLRDEIFCQVCKQINGNPSEASRQKGWTLLACCICSFLPSDEFLPYLENFLKSAPEVERLFCEERLIRTKLNGNRIEPPSSIDHQAIINRGSFSHAVMFMNGQVCKLSLDSATTGLELRKKIKATKGLVDLFGFSFRVNIGARVSMIVGGSDKVMDIISSCEQIAKEFTYEDVCILVFFKEIFSPWQSPSFDLQATQLIYSQMISSIKLMRYTIKEDITLAKMVALHCYVLHGADAGRTDMEETVKALLPNNSISKKNGREYWVNMTDTQFDKKYRHDNRMSRKKAMEILVNHAKHFMTGDFSRHFDLVSVQGPKDVGNASVLLVNWKCVRVLPSQPGHSTWSIIFPEMKKVSYEKLRGRNVGTVTITTIYAREHKLMSSKAEDIHKLLNFFLIGLRNRSRYLLALRDHAPTDNKMGQLGFARGDLITLKGTCNGETLQTTGRGYGACYRTGLSGEFAGGLFYIIPMLQPPSAALMEALRNSSISALARNKVNGHDSMSVLTRSRSWYTPQQTKKEPAQSSQMFIDSKNPAYVNLALSDEPSPGKYDVNELSQNTNTETLLGSRKQEHINNYDVPFLSSKQEKPVQEKPFISDLYVDPTTAERSDFISSNSSFVHHNVLYESLSNYPKPIVQQDESELKRGIGASSTVDASYDYTGRLAQFKERESLKRSENTFLEFHDKGGENSEPFLGSKTNGNDDCVVLNSSASLHDPICEISPNSENDDLAVSEPPLAVYNPIYEAPSVDFKLTIQAVADDLNQESPEKSPKSATDDHESHIAQQTEDETPNITETTTVQERSIDTASLVKRSASPQRQETFLFKKGPSYQAIVTYVSHPAEDIVSEMKLTDTIFGRPLANTTSEDNVYLEIVKHIRAEENDTMVERSWELMWLITGLYSCSENIKDDVISLLRERTDSNSLAKQCYMRLVKMITHGRRTYPPHIAEVQAIQTRMDLINHKVFFPDGSCQSFEVESATTAGHLISVITESIGLKYPNGCGLFFKIGEKVFGAAEEYFFFDFIQHFIEVWRRSETGNNIAVNYQVFFLRKVWIKVIPGADLVADCRLHYYQELSKYLRGYHKCAKEACISLAALIFRAEFGVDTEHLSEIPDMLNRLVPRDVISEMSVDEWQQALEEALSGNSDCVGDDAKIQFLKELSKWPTFGSAFFHAKAIEPSSLPDTLLIAIQKTGLALMTVTEKSVIEKFPFNEIERWSSGGQSFTVNIKTPTESKKLVFHTSLDYQIDDFLTSYIAVYGSEQQEECTTSDEG